MRISVVLIILLAVLYGAKFILDSPFRNQLPANPGPLSKSIGDQITDARRKAFFLTTAANLGALGMVFHSCGDYERAAVCYQLAAKKNSSGWIWSYYLGYLNLEQGQSIVAIKEFNRVLEEEPENQFARYYAAKAYQELQSNDSAGKLFRKIMDAAEIPLESNASSRESSFPLKTYAMFQLARIYISSSQADSAEKILRAIIDDQVTFGPAYRSLAAIYRAKGKDSLSGAYTLRANDLADYIPPADKRLDKIALISRSDQYLLKQIEDAVRSSNYHWALTLCDQALQYFPDNKTLISNAVFENFRQGLDSKALSYLDKHFALFSNDAKELMDLTDILYNKQHLPEALKYFNQVKKLMPQNSTLATWLFERGKKEEALAMMAGLAKRNAGDEKILADAIRLLLNIGDEKSADDYFTRLKQQAPFGAETLRIKGLLAEKEGNLASAGIAYEEAYKMEPKDLIFSRSLIDFYIHQKKWQPAVNHFNAALNYYPNEPSLLEGMGRLLIACPDTTIKNIRQGVAYSERAFINYRSLYQTRLSSGKNLATAYLALGDKKNATKYINETIRIAETVNESEAYISYFRELVSK